MNTSPDHPDFTALALGEHMHGTPAQAVIDALRTSVAARNEADHIRSTAQRLAYALKGEQPAGLGAERLHAIFSADLTAVRAKFAAEEAAASFDEPAWPVVRPPRTWVYPTLAAAAVAAAAFIVMRLLPGLTMPSPQQNRPVAETEPNDRIMVKSPERTTARDKTRLVPPAPPIAGHDGIPLPGPGADLPVPDEPSSLANEAPPALPGPPEVIPPVGSSTPPPRPDPRNFDFATPVAPRKGK